MSRRSCKPLLALSVPDVDLSRLAMRSLPIEIPLKRAGEFKFDRSKEEIRKDNLRLQPKDANLLTEDVYFVAYDKSDRHGGYFSRYFTGKYITNQKPDPRNAAVQVVMDCKLFLDLAGVSQFLEDGDDDEDRYNLFFERDFDLKEQHKEYITDFTPDMATLEVRWSKEDNLWQVSTHDGRHRAWWIYHKLGYRRMVVMIGYDYSTGDADAASPPGLQDVYREQADWASGNFEAVDGYYGLLSSRVRADPEAKFLDVALYQVARTTYGEEFD